MSDRKRNRINELLNKDEPQTSSRAYQGLSDDVFAALDDTQVSTNELPIMSIYADPTQPRRIIPTQIVGEDGWDGDPSRMPALLTMWASAIGDVPIVKILRGEAEPSAFETGNRFVDDFLGLLNLAAQIRSIGLSQEIGVLAAGANYQIIFGERRWTAFHILNNFLPDEDHSMIRAKVADVTPWEVAKMQASENYQREEPNAIAKARMFAKLLIIAHSDNKDVKFDPPHVLNSPSCDRPWYAQVANGETYRIPRGMGGEFEQVLGISTITMRKYRSLLKLTGDHQIDNAIWNVADEYNWAESFLSDIGSYLSPHEIGEILSHIGLYRSRPNGIEVHERVEKEFRDAIKVAKESKEERVEDASPPAPPSNPPSNSPHSVGGGRPSWMDEPPTQPFDASTPSNPPNPPSGSTRSAGGGQDYDARRDENFPWRVADRVLSPNGHLCRVDEIKRDGSIVLQRLDNLRYITYAPGVTLRRADEAPVPGMTGHAPTGLFSVGQWVRDRAGNRYRVLKLGDGDGTVYVERERGGRGWYLAERLSADRPGEGLTGHAPTDDGREYASEGETGTGDASDKGHSGNGADVFASRPSEAQATLAMLYPAARRYDDDAAVVLSALTKLDEQTLHELAEMDAKDADALLVSYETRIASLLERLMTNFEAYTRWVREQANSMREEGGA